MRSRLLESALKVMEQYSSQNALIEIEFYDEEGTGLGPTHEFYTLVSRQLQRSDLQLWRSDASDTEYVHSANGLFPLPLPASRSGVKRVMMYFRFMGRFVAKALQDNRLSMATSMYLSFTVSVDLPLSATFLKLVLGERLGMKDLALVDPPLARSLSVLQNIAAQGRGNSADINALSKTIEDMCLTFTLPGFPHVELLVCVQCSNHVLTFVSLVERIESLL